MATRSRAITEPSEGESAEAPGTIPDGVDADVTVKYRRRVTPAEDNNDIEDMLAEEAANFTPGDPLSGFLEEWGNYIGYNCVIVRLPDPAARRMPGNHYARPCFEMERLGDTPFDPVNFIGTLQMLNNNSGGVFRVWLTNDAGQMMPGARLDRFAIADPPRGNAGSVGQSGQQQAAQITGGQYAPPPPREREQSAIEKQMANLQTRLLETALDRALNPPQPQAPPIAPTMTEEERLAMAVFNRGDVLSTVIQKIASAVQSPENVPAPTWKDKAFDYLLQNPAIGNQIAGIAERATAALINLFPGGKAPAQETAPAPASASAPYVDMPPEAPRPEPIDEDDEDMAILDEVIEYLADDAPMKPDDQIFIDLQKEHPKKFAMFVRAIAAMPIDNVYAFIGAQSQLYAKLLSSNATGPHYKRRIAELKALCVAAVTPTTTNLSGAGGSEESQTAPAPPATPNI